MENEAPEQRRAKAFADVSASLIHEMILTHLAKIEEAAAGAASDSVDVAKVTFTVSWQAKAGSPRINVRMGYGFRVSDETEGQIDPDQEKLPL
jgi:hypothetical protein